MGRWHFVKLFDGAGNIISEFFFKPPVYLSVVDYLRSYKQLHHFAYARVYYYDLKHYVFMWGQQYV